MAKEKVEAIETPEPAPIEKGKDAGEKAIEAKDNITIIPKDADFIDEDKPDKGDYKPLFDEEAILTEAQLSGDEEELPEEKVKGEEPKEQPADQKAEEEKQAAKELEEKKAKEEAEAKSKEEAEAKAAKEKTEKKPPDGYVPHEALHETRELLKKEKAARKALEEKVEKLVAEKEVPEPIMPDGFKVLTDLEFDELTEDDPQAAIRYQAKLLKYESKKIAEKDLMREQQREAESIVMSSVDRIEKAVPGIYDGEQSIAKDLADFAIKSGFKDEAFLEVMTNPATVVIPAGTNKRILLSNGAASMIEMLHNIHTSSAEDKKVDTEKMREEIRAEERKSLTESITKELLTKLKPEHVPSDFRSIEDLPSSQDTPVSSNKQYTEAEWAKLSEEEQIRLLGG